MHSILYGDPKVHKTVVNNTPKFRPILSATNTYLLAKVFKRYFVTTYGYEFTVKNSFDFAEEVVNFDHNLYMASLDIESLFTTSFWKKLLRTVLAFIWLALMLSHYLPTSL